MAKLKQDSEESQKAEKFRIQRNKVGATWSCPISSDENPVSYLGTPTDEVLKVTIWEITVLKFGECDYIIAEEEHHNGKKHYHAYFIVF